MLPSEPAHSQSKRSRALVVQLAALAVGLAIAVPHEWARLQEASSSEAGVWRWLSGINVDTTLLLLLLILAPLPWFIRSSLAPWPRWLRVSVAGWLSTRTMPGIPSEPGSLLRAWILALFVAAVSWTASSRVAAIEVRGAASLRFGELPSAYHDEYSYLLLARTFLDGRLSYPSHAQTPRLFDQMHVVNEGRFASRYFPGAGAWMAPFVALGRPYWGHWLAGALTAMLIFWAGRELGGNGAGLLAGLLTALSPGMALFSNLLLAHHPALVGLSLFLWAVLRLFRSRRPLDAVLAGTGLTFAMLCRPLTAAGFGLPFGIWFVVWLVRRREKGSGVTGQGSGVRDQRSDSRLSTLNSQRGDHSPLTTHHTPTQCETGLGPFSAVSAGRRLAILTGMTAPLLAGLTFLFFYNRAITGDGFTTPYEVFQTTYTPRHAYGFHNAERAEQRVARGEARTNRAFEHYDRWAENLTPERAVRNVANRFLAGWRWTLGIIPLAMATVVFVAGGLLSGAPSGERRWWLIPAAILSLHLFHAPYWYDGIMHWHYVFETGPLWTLLFAGGSLMLLRWWRAGGRTWMPAWWGALVAASLLPAWIAVPPFWSQSRVGEEVSGVSWSRLRYHYFQRMLDRHVTERPALVLVRHDTTEQHIDFVVNDPGWESEVLIGRYRPEVIALERIVGMFPDRALYLYDVKTNRLMQLRRPDDSTTR